MRVAALAARVQDGGHEDEGGPSGEEGKGAGGCEAFHRSFGEGRQKDEWSGYAGRNYSSEGPNGEPTGKVRDVDERDKLNFRK